MQQEYVVGHSADHAAKAPVPLQAWLLTSFCCKEAIHPLGGVWAFVCEAEALAVLQGAVAPRGVYRSPQGTLRDARLEVCRHLRTVALVDLDVVHHGSLQGKMQD